MSIVCLRFPFCFGKAGYSYTVLQAFKAVHCLFNGSAVHSFCINLMSVHVSAWLDRDCVH